MALTDERSLIQNTFDRVKGVTSKSKIYIVTEKSLVSGIAEQLPEVEKCNIIAEPARRGTASGVLLALNAIKKALPHDEPILFLWADHLIRNTSGFVACMLRAGELSKQYQKLVFVGIEPSYASTGFGYMRFGKQYDDWNEVYELEKFVEKPDAKTAKRYIDSGKYLWNTGYLVGSYDVFVEQFKKHNSDLLKQLDELDAAADKDVIYLSFSSQPIDTALSERIDDAIVVPGGFDWTDVGSFQDLHKVNEHDDDGNVVSGSKIALEQATNSYIRNELADVPLAVIGLDNVIVVATDDGVLVSNKNFAQKVGDVAKKLNG